MRLSALQACRLRYKSRQSVAKFIIHFWHFTTAFPLLAAAVNFVTRFLTAHIFFLLPFLFGFLSTLCAVYYRFEYSIQ